MNIEQSELLQRFRNNLESAGVICPKCAETLRANIDMVLIDPSYLNRVENLELHIRCTLRLLMSLSNKVSEELTRT